MSIDQLDPRTLPAHLRDTFITWRGQRSSTARSFGDAATIKGAHPVASAVADHTKAALAAWVDGAAGWWRLQADVTRTDAGRLVAGAKQLRAKTKAPQEALTKAYVGAIEAGDDVRQRLDRKLQTPDPAQAITDGELRAYLRGLPHTERGPLVRSDVRYAAAVARAPAQLSGASGDLYAAARDSYLREAAPADLDAYNDLQAAVTVAKESLAALEHLPRQALGCDFKKADELAKASEAAEA